MTTTKELFNALCEQNLKVKTQMVEDLIQSGSEFPDDILDCLGQAHKLLKSKKKPFASNMTCRQFIDTALRTAWELSRDPWPGKRPWVNQVDWVAG